MASQDVVSYRSPLTYVGKVLVGVFLAVYLSGPCCRSS